MSTPNESKEETSEVANKYNDRLVASLEMLDCSIQYYVPEDGVHKPYYMLVNPQRKDFPLRLYRSAMVKLVDGLPKAFAKASELESNYPGDEMHYEIALVHKYNNSYVRLVVITFSETAYVYIRLYDKRDDKMEPTRYGVRLMKGDNLAAFNDFVAKCK